MTTTGARSLDETQISLAGAVVSRSLMVSPLDLHDDAVANELMAVLGTTAPPKPVAPAGSEAVPEPET